MKRFEGTEPDDLDDQLAVRYEARRPRVPEDFDHLGKNRLSDLPDFARSSTASHRLKRQAAEPVPLRFILPGSNRKIASRLCLHGRCGQRQEEARHGCETRSLLVPASRDRVRVALASAERIREAASPFRQSDLQPRPGGSGSERSRSSDWSEGPRNFHVAAGLMSVRGNRKAVRCQNIPVPRQASPGIPYIRCWCRSRSPASWGLCLRT